MRGKIFFLIALVLLVIAGACSSGASKGRDGEVFLTKKAALQYFLEENKGNDVEAIQTTEDDELFMVRSGNDQYSMYGMTEENERFSVEKLTATLSLHNTKSGGAEFTTRNGNDYTYTAAKELKGLPPFFQQPNQFFTVFSKDAYLALSKGHIFSNDTSSSSVNAIQTTETVPVNLSFNPSK